MGIIAHTMEYQGGSVVSRLQPRNYSVFDFDEYRTMYEECFRDMRTALGIFPVDCCGSKEELEQKKEKIYVFEIDGEMVGSVAIYGNEIDDLIVKKAVRGWDMEKCYCNSLYRFYKKAIFSQSHFMLQIGIREQSKCT